MRREAGAEIIFVINIYCSQCGGGWDEEKLMTSINKSFKLEEKSFQESLNKVPDEDGIINPIMVDDYQVQITIEKSNFNKKKSFTERLSEKASKKSLPQMKQCNNPEFINKSLRKIEGKSKSEKEDLKKNAVKNDHLTKSFYSKTQVSLKMTIENMFNYLKAKEKPSFKLKITYLNYLTYKMMSICKRRKKQDSDNNKFDYFEKGKSLIKEQLNGKFILKKMIEIDKLKSILLNENQLVVFNYISKPRILLHDTQKRNTVLSASPTEKMKNSSMLKNNPISNELDTVVKFCNTFMNEKSENLIDQRLFNLVDKKLFDHIQVEKKEELFTIN